MNTILYIFLLACSVFLGGCSQSKQIPKDLAETGEPPPEITRIAEETAPEKSPAEVVKIAAEGLGTGQEPPEMIEVENFSVAGNTLTLDYRVSNPFKDDIRVCHDRAVYGNQDVQHAITRIDGETARIILACKPGRNSGFVNPPPVAKYVRVSPGESYSGRIVMDLPIRDHFRERREDGKDPKAIVLQRAVFEVGYFGPKWNGFFGLASDRIRMTGAKPRPTIIGPYYYLSFDPTVTEEIVDGKLREVIYVSKFWASEEEKESTEVIIIDVAIPCSTGEK